MKKDRDTIIKYAGLYLLTFIFLLFVISMFFFYLGISINNFNFYFSLFISTLLFSLYMSKKKIPINVSRWSLIIGVIVLVSAILIATPIYDRSSDGNTYHKDAVGNLYLGWNPVKENVSTFVKTMKVKNYNFHSYDVWKEHYAKANWILEANFYKVTDNIESGKALNLICMFILFSMALTYLGTKLDDKKAILLSLVITFNPITCNQLFTFYNDQLGTTLLFSLIIILLEIVEKKDKYYFIDLFMLITLLVNIKFNVMGYTLVFSFVFMIYYLIKNKKIFKQIIFKLIGYWLLLFIFSFIVMGYPTYVKNYLNKGNMFYPVYGEKAIDIITKQEPKDFIKMNSLEKFFIATFSKVNNLQSNKTYQLKIPFTFTLEEVKDSMAVDTRISGFGIFFSGLLLISIIVLGKYLIKEKKGRKEILLILGTTIFIIVAISESWWARYNPSTYLILISALYVLLKYNKRKYLNYIIVFLVIINSLVILGGNSYYGISNSYKINRDLSKLNNKEVLINFNRNEMTGIIYNLNDKKIKYEFTKNKLKNITYYKYLNYEIKKQS
jgi:hypothetical protein